MYPESSKYVNALLMYNCKLTRFLKTLLLLGAMGWSETLEQVHLPFRNCCFFMKQYMCGG